MTDITVTSRSPLSDERKSAIGRELKNKYGEYTVKYVVDDALIGGLIVFDGEKVYNGSVSGRLEALRRAVKGKLQ